MTNFARNEVLQLLFCGSATVSKSSRLDLEKRWNIRSWKVLRSNSLRPRTDPPKRVVEGYLHPAGFDHTNSSSAQLQVSQDQCEDGRSDGGPCCLGHRRASIRQFCCTVCTPTFKSASTWSSLATTACRFSMPTNSFESDNIERGNFKEHFEMSFEIKGLSQTLHVYPTSRNHLSGIVYFWYNHPKYHCSRTC